MPKTAPKIPLSILSVVLGAVAIVLSFLPVEAQIVGIVLGIGGLVAVRKARRTEYTKDMTISIGMVLCIAGLGLCLIAPLLSLIANLLALFA